MTDSRSGGAPVSEQPSRTFSHDGSTLVASERGEGETVFVLVHGLGMGRLVFDDLAQILAERGRVIAVDLPGYGEAPEPPRTPTIERMADLVAAYLRGEGLGDVVLVGHSMGSQVATEVAVRHGLASRLVLIAPSVDASARRTGEQARRLARDLLDESPTVLLLGARAYLHAGPHLRRKIRAMMVHRPENAYPRVTCPALVLRGAEDLVSPRAWCHRVVDLLPTAEYAEIPGHGHETVIKNARPAADRILDWLDRP
ncbi:alpha/beta hydrolase [Microbacterium sp. LRZ72]|uniref:alpha/beta fold hydrolase n=1 Tax=Microbacterium sp. LRZ72 TaxID=2942481 RepID=UPI0029B319D8|nr:alpha/beta hydrolase [Microbacterium sp. LRZ72]MDX2376062.1 alpha/beta hydrolase [Microbacterium sp. LRZ72]